MGGSDRERCRGARRFLVVCTAGRFDAGQVYMSLFSRRYYPGQTADQMIPPRPEQRNGTAVVTNDSALRHSAVWACLRLRANLISTMPVDVYRNVGKIQVDVPKPPVLVNPGGERVDIQEWLYS